jgi:plasmid maintenance system antidote protein VapI
MIMERIHDTQILAYVDPDWFWSQVKQNAPHECWPWLGSTNEQGYGRVAVGQQQRARAHRVAYLFGTGLLLNELNALHTCDNPPCCNYQTHLFPGTQLDNIADMVAKGREAIGPTRLTAKEVTEIKQRYGNGESARILAELYNVRPQQIRRIANGTRRRRHTTPLITPAWKTQGFYGPHTKITPAQVTEIITRYQQENITQRALATEYGLVQSYISRIVTNKARGN